MIIEKPQYEPNIKPALQFIIFCGITLSLLLAGGLLAMVPIYLLYGPNVLKLTIAMDLSSPKAVSSLWILQILGTTVPILFTPVVFSKYIVKQPNAYLRLNFRFPGILLAIIFSIMLMSSPIMEVLVTLNQKMVLPEFLKGVERWMRASEDAAQKATTALLRMNNWIDLVKAVLVVGVITAIAEELMFRGGLQTIMLRWTTNPHTAIWITAALFSAFHLEFFGFLPRLMLGVFFGYFTMWSGSIWPAAWAHFLNNGTAVVMTYLYQHKKIDINIQDQHSFNYSLYVLSILITVALFWSYRTAAQRKNHL